MNSMALSSRSSVSCIPRMASALGDGMGELIVFVTGRRLHPLKRHQRPVHALDINSTGGIVGNVGELISSVVSLTTTANITKLFCSDKLPGSNL